jgi:hypothetical protein
MRERSLVIGFGFGGEKPNENQRTTTDFGY